MSDGPVTACNQRELRGGLLFRSFFKPALKSESHPCDNHSEMKIAVQWLEGWLTSVVQLICVSTKDLQCVCVESYCATHFKIVCNYPLTFFFFFLVKLN